jgi:hypothetical protein
MTALDPPGPHQPSVHDAPTPSGVAGPSAEPLSTLRGASVGQVNVRLIGQVLALVGMVTLTVLVVVFALAGAHRNSQISTLRTHGVAVDMKVVNCAVQLGGSGSNPAGYQCVGTLSVNGHRYTEPIPGITKYNQGQILHVVVVPTDPALLSTVHDLSRKHTSASVYVLPIVLFVALVLLLVGLVVERRRHSSAPAVGGAARPQVS